MLRRTSLLAVLVLGLSIGAVAPAFAGVESDDTIAEDAVLTDDDVSSYGLTETDPSDDPPPSGAVCKRVRLAIKAADRASHAQTSFHDSAGTTTVNDEAVIFENAKAAKAQLAAYSDAKAPRCLQSQIKTSLEETLEPGSSYEFSGERIDIPLGDGGFAYQLVISITDPEGTVTDLYAETGLIRVGRGVAVLAFTATGAPFPGSEDLATVVTDRLTESVG